MRRTILISAAVAGVTMACVFLVIAAQAAGPVLKVDPADTPLRIDGVLDGQTNSFSGNVRLTVTGGAAPQVRFLASDLRDVTPPEITIDRSSITTFPANISLSDGQPSDVKVTIGNVKRAGDYTGTLQFLVSGQPLTQTLTIPLELHVDVKPDVEPVVADQSFQVTRCWGIECRLAEILLSGSATREVWHIQLDNQASQPAAVTNAQAVMRGNRTAEAVTSTQVKIGPLEVLPANQVSTVPVTIVRNGLLPDRYQGKLRFTLAGLDNPVTINGTLDVRNGPFWALVAILLGIVVGRMARDMETPIAKKQVKLLPRWYDLREKIDPITNQPAREKMKSELQQAKAKIDSATDTEEVASKFLGDLEAKVSFLIDLQTIEDNLKTLPVDQEKAKGLIEEARSFLLAGEAEKAEQVRTQIKDLIRTAEARAKADTPMGLGDDIKEALSSIASRLSRPAESSLMDSQEALTVANARQASSWRRFLAGLSGLQFVTAETRFWFFRPVLSVLLLVLLTLLGLQTLYVNSGATFGVGGLYDYLGLFLWGITADVAQRTLLNLPVARASA